MFDWVGDAINWIGNKIGGAVEDVGSSVSEAVCEVTVNTAVSAGKFVAKKLT